MPELIVGNSLTEIQGEFDHYSLISVLSKEQRFYIRNKYTKKGEWKTRDIILFNKKTNQFPTGLLPTVLEIIPKSKIIDNRKLNFPVSLPKTDIILRDYQQRAFNACWENGCGIVQIPTAGGKTFLAMKLIEKLKSKTLYIVPNLELLYETYRKFITYFPEHLLGIIGDDTLNISEINIATAQTIWSKIKSSQLQDLLSSIDFLLLDECHRINESKYFKFANSWYQLTIHIDAYYRFGMSATIDDEKSISRFLLEAAVGPLIYKQEVKELIDKNMIVQPYIYFIENDIAFAHWKRNDWHTAKKDGIMRNHQRNLLISEIAQYHKENGDTTLIIVEEIKNHGELLHKLIPDSVFLHGLTEDKERKRLRDEFREDSIPILITTLFNEGVDYSNIDVVILATGGKSSKNFYQRIGRAMRLDEGKDKAIIYDFYDMDNSILEKHSSQRYRLAKKEEGFKTEYLREFNQENRILEEIRL